MSIVLSFTMIYPLLSFYLHVMISVWISFSLYMYKCSEQNDYLPHLDLLLTRDDNGFTPLPNIFTPSLPILVDWSPRAPCKKFIFYWVSLVFGYTYVGKTKRTMRSRNLPYNLIYLIIFKLSLDRCLCLFLLIYLNNIIVLRHKHWATHWNTGKKQKKRWKKQSFKEAVFKKLDFNIWVLQYMRREQTFVV